MKNFSGAFPSLQTVVRFQFYTVCQHSVLLAVGISLFKVFQVKTTVQQPEHVTLLLFVTFIDIPFFLRSTSKVQSTAGTWIQVAYADYSNFGSE